VSLVIFYRITSGVKIGNPTQLNS